jgi:hypothetical protein
MVLRGRFRAGPSLQGVMCSLHIPPVLRVGDVQSPARFFALERFSNGVEREVTRKNAAIKQLRAVDPIQSDRKPLYSPLP